MFTKDELEQMDPAGLVTAAAELGLSVSPEDTRENVIYAILDKAAEAASKQADDSKPKRTRSMIAKKAGQQEDRIFTAKGKRAESHDRKKKKAAATQEDNETREPKTVIETETIIDVNETMDMNEDAGRQSQSDADYSEETMMQNAQLAEAFPKHRGRRSQAELKAMRQMYVRLLNEQQADTTDADTDTDPVQRQEGEAMSETDGSGVTQLQIDMLQQHMNEQNAQATAGTDAEAADTVWEGDPGNGIDFIIVQDLPIEDQGAMPMLDMLDRPVGETAAVQQQATRRNKDTKGFSLDDVVSACGVLELQQEGYGFLRSSDYNYLSSPDDVFVPQQVVKRYGLKTGDVVMATVKVPRDGDKYFLLGTISSVNGRRPETIRDRVAFEHLTPLFPDQKFTLCGDRATTNPSVRLVDLFAPIGKGQRALIVAQPKTGKTILMKDIANAIAANHPEAYLMMLLIDERPEEVTDMARTVNAEVVASTFDEPAERHVKIAGIVLEKAKRMVECGHDVVIFLDSITRLARAYNTVAPASGKILTGGVDANALQKPKRFFGAARNIEGGGSLTIIATALIDTGSKMDEVIFEEFKGTGNMELQLDRMLSNKRIFPAINLVQSSTRRDDLLQDPTTLNRMWIIRKIISEMNPVEAMTTVRDRLVHSKDNDEFLMSMNG